MKPPALYSRSTNCSSERFLSYLTDHLFPTRAGLCCPLVVTGLSSSWPSLGFVSNRQKVFNERLRTDGDADAVILCKSSAGEKKLADGNLKHWLRTLLSPPTHSLFSILSVRSVLRVCLCAYTCASVHALLAVPIKACTHLRSLSSTSTPDYR